MKLLPFMCVVVLLAVVAIGLQVSVWNECRNTNSFFYCLMLVSR